MEDNQKSTDELTQAFINQQNQQIIRSPEPRPQMVSPRRDLAAEVKRMNACVEACHGVPTSLLQPGMLAEIIMALSDFAESGIEFTELDDVIRKYLIEGLEKGDREHVE